MINTGIRKHVLNINNINLFMKKNDYIKCVNINKEITYIFKMRKLILFPSYLLIIGMLTIGCYNKPKPTTSAMIILKNVHKNNVEHDCQQCYKKIYRTIKNSTRGIHDIDISQSQDKSTMLILIEYNHTIGNINDIKKDLIVAGYDTDLE
tara:strand:+ start:717 stop:1166 length:450 start_codon:yes stop_codon:yes gene_type:complete